MTAGPDRPRRTPGSIAVLSAAQASTDAPPKTSANAEREHGYAGCAHRK